MVFRTASQDRAVYVETTVFLHRTAVPLGFELDSQVHLPREVKATLQSRIDQIRSLNPR